MTICRTQKRRNKMSTGVQITLIICVTLVAIIWIASKYNDNSNNKKKQALNMKEKTTKKNLGEDMLRFIIKLYESQEKIKITYTIKN